MAAARPCYCGATEARIYKDGPACDVHAPWALAGHPPPKPGPGYEQTWKPIWDRRDSLNSLNHTPEPHHLARKVDRRTSHLAAHSIRGVEGVYRRIAALLGERGPLTDEELWEFYQSRAENGVWPMVSPSGLRTRRSEMVTAGDVRDTGQVRRTRAGRTTTVWCLAA